MSAPDERRTLLLAKLFDLRTFIGALFVIFGAVVTVEGLAADAAAIAKASGINLSLWTGLGMLLVGVAFVAWMLLDPPRPDPPRPDPPRPDPARSDPARSDPERRGEQDRPPGHDQH